MFSKLTALLLSFVALFSSISNTDLNVRARRYDNVSYGKAEDQVLDLSLPPKSDDEVGLLLMIHGGSWIQGDKSYYSKYLEEGTKRFGIACASINHRFLYDVDMFQMLDDITSSMKKIKSVAKKKGVNISKVMLLGYSSGAHLSLLYAYTRAESSPLRIVSVASFSGPTDFTDDDFIKNSKYVKYFSMTDLASLAVGYEVTEETLEKAVKSISPAFQVRKNSVPTFVVHGKKDTVVPYSNAKTLVKALKRNEVPYHFVSLANSTHSLYDELDEKAAKKADNTLRTFIAYYLTF